MQQKQPLSKEEIKRAKMLVDELHPLSDQPWYRALTLFPPKPSGEIKKQNDNEKKNKFKQQLQLQLGKEERKDQEGQPPPGQGKPDIPNDQDVVNYLGYGMVSYFTLITLLIKIFFVIFLINIPTMYIYASYHNYHDLSTTKMTAYVSLGNMGYSQTKCMTVGMQVDQIYLGCNTGIIAKIVDYGIAAKYESHDYCMSNTTGTCYSSLSSTLNTTMNKCLYNKTCMVTGLKSYVTSNNSTCRNEDANFHVQYMCAQTYSDLHIKRGNSVLISCVCIFQCMYILIMIYYTKSMSYLTQIQWDIQTVTAGDYTGDMKITPEQYSYFQDHVYNSEPLYRNESVGFALKLFLKKELEKRLTEEVESQGFENIQKVEISEIQFSYKNNPLMRGLEKRGKCISSNDWANYRKINEELDQIKNKHYQDLITPVSAFMSFESEEGLQRFLSLKENKNFLLLSQNVIVDPATEPTNIIWENRQFTPTQRFVRATIVTIIIGFILFCSASIIIYLKQVSKNANSKYQQVDCVDINMMYNSTMLQDYAVEAWLEYYLPANASSLPTSQISGVLNCFCTNQKTLLGTFTVSSTLFTDLNNRSVYACSEWVLDAYIVYAYSYSVSILINVVNSLLKVSLISLICAIKEDTISQQAKSITLGVFLAQFFNTAFALLLAMANFSETNIPIFKDVFTGTYTDLHAGWFLDIGKTLVQTMLINAFMPPIELAIGLTKKYVFKLMDTSFKKDSFWSKKKSIQQYVDLYAGPILLIHVRYSTLLNTVFVTMMFGTALPLLYPIAFLTFVMFYFNERYCICYYYKQPPSFDAKMTSNALDMIRWAPVFCLAFTYWSLSNNQIFNNILFVYTKIGDVTYSGHTVISDLASLYYDPEIPPFIFALLLILILPLSAAIGKMLNMKVEMEVDEDLGNYFQALEPSDKQWMVKEEDNLRNNYRVKITPDDIIRKLKQTKSQGKSIQGVHCYDILANIDYVQRFQYVPADVPNRELMIQDDDEDEGNDAVQADIIRIALNLGMLKENMAQKLSFKKEKIMAAFQ